MVVLLPGAEVTDTPARHSARPDRRPGREARAQEITLPNEPPPTTLEVIARKYATLRSGTRLEGRTLGRLVASGILLAGLAVPARGTAQTPAPPTAAQNPSPMVESTRTHERLTARELGGTTRAFVGPAGKPVELWFPEGAAPQGALDLVIHFHGAAWIPEQAVAALGDGTAAVVVNLGAGSGTYDRAFADPATFDSLLAGVLRTAATTTGRTLRLGRVSLVGFSAGHGAVRAILREPRHFASVSAVLLLDGMHTSYVPESRPLAHGGALDTMNLVAFAAFARAAVRGEKRFIVTHSEIFPGTFASTTETSDWLLAALAIRRSPVLAWGPRGTQQLSEVRAGGFELVGFAGNSAPDHIDQFHAMPELLTRLLRSAVNSAP